MLNLSLPWFGLSQKHQPIRKPLWSSSGFSLVEVTITLAISGLLLAMAVYGNGQLKRRSQFSDGVERVKNAIERVKTEASTTVNQGGGTGGADPYLIFWGKLISFSGGVMRVDTLVLDSQPPFGPGCAGSPTAIKLCTIPGETYTVNLPWGVVYTAAGPPPSTGERIVFVRSQVNGDLITYTLPPGLPGNWENRPDNYDIYNPTIRSSLQYRFTDPNGRRATITVDAVSGGISRSYDN